MPYIPIEVFANNATTTVTAGGTTAPSAGTTETWTVASSSAFPAVEIGAQQFHVADPVLPSEVIAVTNISGATWTVTRGSDGTAPVAHTSGFTVWQVIPAGVLSNFEYEPWQFPVQAYGAQGDGKVGTGGTGTSGTNTFTDSGATFINNTAPLGDVGKVILINQGTGSATVGTNPFCGTITAVNSATSVTLSANLGANCSAAPYVYGTDDSSAITAAVTAAASWASSTGNYKAQVLFGPQIYMLGALTQTTTQTWANNPEGPYTYNTHIPIPCSGQYQRKMTLDFIGVGDASGQPFWGSAIPSVEGTRLVSAVFPPTQPDATFGQMSMIGTPSTASNIGNGGITNGNFANVLVNITGIMLVPPFNGQQYGFDFRYATMANIDNGSVIAFAPINFAAQTVGGPWMRWTNIPSNLTAVALAMPYAQNNDNSNVGNFAVMGVSIGVLISEHFTAQRLATIYCGRGIQVTWLPAGTLINGGSILYWDCEGCNYGIYTNQGVTSQFQLNILSATFESMNTAYVNDPNGNLSGSMHFTDFGVSGPTGIGVIGAQNYKIINDRQTPGPWLANANFGLPAAPSAPATGTAQQNTAYRDAIVYASATTSITSIAVGPASGSLTSITVTHGANVAVPIQVPSGHWYSVTYSGTLTTTWVLQ